MNALYQQDEVKRFRWHRGLEMNGTFQQVVVDFLADDVLGSREGQLQRIQDISAATIHGCDLAFLDPVPITLAAANAESSTSHATGFMVSLPQFLAMKGLALRSRDRPQSDGLRASDGAKDAYDIYFVVRNYLGGGRALAQAIRPHLEHPTMAEGLRCIRDKWNSVGSRGPTLVAQRLADREERTRRLFSHDDGHCDPRKACGARRGVDGRVREFLPPIGQVQAMKAVGRDQMGHRAQCSDFLTEGFDLQG